MPSNGLTILDYVIILCYAGTIVSIGVYFSRRQTSTDKYFAGGRSMPSWAIGMSVMATSVSSVTFLAYPGEGFSGNWIRLVQGLMLPIVIVCIAWFIVPCYRRVIGLSAYEYFEKRFGLIARLYSSLAFVLVHFSKMGTVFFLLALALAKITGLGGYAGGTYCVIFALGTLTILYTLIGGIEAVIWSDVVQGLILICGGLLCAVILMFGHEAGPGEVITMAWRQGKMSMGPMDVDLVRLTFIVMALNGIFWWIQKYGTDQAVVQRFLVAKSDKEAVKGVLMGAFLCIPVWVIFMFIGTGLWAYYRIAQLNLPPDLKAEEVFPYFIMTQIPAGVTGLILAALISAAMSSLDSDLNCLAAVGVEDYYRRFKPGSTDKQCLTLGRIIVVVSGIFAIGVACLYVHFEGKGVLGIIFTLYSIFSGGIAGLFVLAFFCPRANKKGLYIGMVACILFTGYALLTKNTYNIFGRELHLELGRFNFTHHPYMLGVYSHLVLFGVGYVASLFFTCERPAKHLTFYGWLEHRRQ
jgi:SSS family solute:Na+ symporter